MKKPPYFKAQSPQVQPTPLSVEKLIVLDKREWDVEMVKEVLVEDDAALVERLPLSQKSRLDKLIWRETISGILTAKFAYYEARRLLQLDEVDRNSRSLLWKRIWTIRVAPKLKVFIWRLIQKYISTKINLLE